MFPRMKEVEGGLMECDTGMESNMGPECDMGRK